MSGLRARLRRHFNRNNAPHWHVDYLTNRAPIDAIAALESEERIECKVADALKGSLAYIAQFGCSDCECRSHLFFAASEMEARDRLEGVVATFKVNYLVMGRKELRTYLRHS